MEQLELVYMLIALVLGTQLCRFIPLVLPKSLLAHPVLQKLNKMLPLVIMILLVVTSIQLPDFGLNSGYSRFFAQLLALVAVIISYRWKKNILLSVGLGIILLNILLELFG